MEGDRHMVSVIFLFFIGFCEYGITAHGNHAHIRVIQTTIPKQDVSVPTPTSVPEPVKEDNKCIAIVRRTFLERESVVYPCFRPMRGVTPVAAHQSPMGLICRGVTTVPQTKYARVPICCPGFEDIDGACVQRSFDSTLASLPAMDGQPTTAEDQLRRLEELEKYPSTYEKRPYPRWSPGEILMKRLRAVMDRRMQLIKELEQKMGDQELTPTPQSPISRMFPQVRKMIMITRTLRPIQPPLSIDTNNSEAPQIPTRQEQPKEDSIPQMPERKNVIITHTQQNIMHRFPTINRQSLIVSQRRDNVVHMPQHRLNPDFPQIPRATPSPVQKENPFFLHPDFAHQQLSNRQQLQRQMIPDMHFRQIQQPVFQRHFPGVHLPKFPIEMPPVIVQPGPNLMAPPPCFAAYLNIVKMCFGGANIQMPQDQGMFNGEYNYDGVCKKKDEITNCIVRHIRPCNNMQEQMMVKTTLTNTFAEIDRICHFDQIPHIEERLNSNTPDNMQPMPHMFSHKDDDHHHDHTHSHGDHTHSHPHSHGHTHDHAHNKVVLPIEAKPVEAKSVEAKVQKSSDDDDVKAPKVAGVKEEIKVKSEPTRVDTAPNHAHPQIQQVDGQIIVHEYYLPLLIGTAIGVVAIIILLLALVCVCCRRRLSRKIYLEKEPEKPKLLDGIYTIGLPPPIYEVNGIPPLSYEEAKGEKITGSPSSIRRHNVDNAAAEETTSRKGVVSDI